MQQNCHFQEYTVFLALMVKEIYYSGYKKVNILRLIQKSLR